MFGKRKPAEDVPLPLAPGLYAIRLVKILFATNIAFAVLAIAAFCLLVMLFPLKEKELVFVEFQSAGNNFVRVRHADGELRADTQLIGWTTRMYVSARETVDQITERERYQAVMAMSSSQVANTFRTVYGGPDALLNRDGCKREVKILRDSPLAYGIHQVEFETTDTPQCRTTTEPVQWVATLSYSFSDQLVTYADRYANLLGLFVDEYSLSRRSL